MEVYMEKSWHDICESRLEKRAKFMKSHTLVDSLAEQHSQQDP